MSISVAIANAKGGVGKSLTTMMLADGLALSYGARVLVIDADPQAGVTKSLLGIGAEQELHSRQVGLATILRIPIMGATSSSRRIGYRGRPGRASGPAAWLDRYHSVEPRAAWRYGRIWNTPPGGKNAKTGWMSCCRTRCAPSFGRSKRITTSS